jgi:hypothetical protein
MMKFTSLLMIIAALAGCGGSGGSSSNGGGDQRGDISDRPIDGREAEYTITVVEHIGENTFYKEVNAFEGFPMEFELIGAQTDEYFLGNFEIGNIDGCGGVRRLYDGDDSIWETVNNVPGNCTIKVEYSLTRTDLPHLIDVDITGYGASISPLHLSASQGKPAYFFLNVKDGYDASVSGCGGRRADDQYIVDSVSEDCTVNVSTSPTSDGALTISTTAMQGAVVYPESALVNMGDEVSFTIKHGAGFDTVVTGCNGELSEGVYTVQAQSSCNINVEAYPKNNAPIISVETTDDYPVILTVQTRQGEDYQYTVSEAPYVALTDDISMIQAELKRPSQSIIVSSEGCNARNADDHGDMFIYSSVHLYRTRPEYLDDNSPDEALDNLDSDCTWTLNTEPSNYKQYGKSGIAINLWSNEQIEGADMSSIAFTGTATQFIIDQPGYVLDELGTSPNCKVERRDNIVTIYHGQTLEKDYHEVEYGELPELCSAYAQMYTEDYLFPWEQ